MAELLLAKNTETGKRTASILLKVEEVLSRLKSFLSAFAQTTLALVQLNFDIMRYMVGKTDVVDFLAQNKIEFRH